MDKPILFSAPMVRAILDGRKTVTRRGLSKSNTFFNGMTWPKYVRIGDCNWQSAWVDAGPSPAGNTGPYLHVEWPYGKLCDGGTDEKLWARVYPRTRPGDIIWVRERFLPDAPETGAGWDDEGLSFVEWDGCGRRLDGVPKIYRKPEYCIFAADPKWSSATDWKWRPSIHMPRWASRLTLRVTAVKVERLQDISEEDAIAEGIIAMRSRAGSVPITVYGYDANAQNHSPSARDAFSFLWTSINGPGSWDVNPWVASYSFERVT
jgi:hypothetical protein